MIDSTIPRETATMIFKLLMLFSGRPLSDRTAATEGKNGQDQISYYTTESKMFKSKLYASFLPPALDYPKVLHNTARTLHVQLHR